MKLLIVDVWIESNALVATIWVKRDDGEVAMFQQERPIKLLEKLLDNEAVTAYTCLS